METTEKIVKTYFENEFYNSKELKDIFSSYAASELHRYIRISQLPSFKFIAAYVTEVDPKQNYGRTYKLYKMYQVLECGMTFIKEVSGISCLSNQGIERVIIDNGELIFTGDYYRKDKEARKILSKTGMVFC